MRTGDVNLENEMLHKGNPSKDSKKKEAMEQAPIMVTLFPLLSMLVAILPGILKHSPVTETIKVGIIVLILTGVASFYIKYNYEQLQTKLFNKTIIILGYLLSICLLQMIPYPECFHFWMIGGLLVAMLIDKKLGLLLHFNLSILLGIALTMNIGTVLQVLIMGVMLCFLSGALQSKATVIYSAIILLSMNITVAFVINNFKFDEQTNYDYLLSMLSLLLVIVVSFFLSMIYHSKAGGSKLELNAKTNQVELLLERQGFIKDKPQEAIPSAELTASVSVTSESSLENSGAKDLSVQELAATSEEAIEATMLFQDPKTNYDVLCDRNNILIQRMKDYSEALYQHALTIGELSHRAALAIGANETLTLAGGLYHEVGKIKGKNYIEEGLILAQEYGFPNELKAILKEHNIKYENPNSVEAVIVMLADNIVTTIEYIEKNDDRKFTAQKIIENIFQLRMDKGTFDSANLSLKDYKTLKEFFINEFSMREIGR
jgi:putative nucleotidyltransferase with HDIG domain